MSGGHLRLKIYQTRIRSKLEFAAPVSHSGLTKEQSSVIEMVHKNFFLFLYRHELILVWFNIGNEDPVLKKIFLDH